MPALRSLFAPILAALALGCTKSPEGPPVCAPGAACPDASVCVIGRCRPKEKDTSLAATGARRLLLFPDAVAVVSQRGASGGGAQLPSSVSLGRREAGETSILLHFEVPIEEPAQVTAAFLVLEAASSSPSPSQPVPLEIARILEPWSAEHVAWGSQPRLDLPEAAGGATSMSSPLRIDVTHLVRAFAERREDEHGLALLAGANDAFGVTLSLGVEEKRGPRLEVYVR